MYTTPIHDRIEKELKGRKEKNLLRNIALPPSIKREKLIDCSTNSYLGLHEKEEIHQETLLLTGKQTHGNLASRLIACKSDLYSQLEKEIAEWEGSERALVFSSGYSTNIGVIQALCSRSTEVFCDKLNHASIYDGIKLSGCKLIRYKHCDMFDLREKIRASKTTEKIIITDTIFSMDGDKAPLCDIAEIALTYKALVIVDEAHATGIFGENRSGVVEESGTQEVIQIRIGTLSKAIAGMGGYVATSSLFVNYFVNFSRSFIFSTALPHSVIAHNLAAIRYIRNHPELGKTLLDSAQNMRQKLEKIGFSTKPSVSQIIPIYTKDAEEALSLSSYLRAKNIIIPAIRPPAVPEGTSRLRLSWNLLITEEDSEKIIYYLTKWKNGERN